jgi:DNA-binding NtrC family response regulator
MTRSSGILLKRFAKKAGKKITTIDRSTLAILEHYDWPGNIRELQNVIERAVILCETTVLYVDETWFRRETRFTNRATYSF